MHGFLSHDEESPFATFLVYDSHFDTHNLFHRIKWADITFKFASSEPGGRPPEIVEMVPFGRYALMPTTMETSRTREACLSANNWRFGATTVVFRTFFQNGQFISDDEDDGGRKHSLR